MFAVPVTRETRPVAVLLGGSGHARIATLHTPQVAALLRPYLPVFAQNSFGREVCAGVA